MSDESRDPLDDLRTLGNGCTAFAYALQHIANAWQEERALDADASKPSRENTGDWMRRCESLEVENADLRAKLEASDAAARSWLVVAKENESDRAALRKALDEEREDAGRRIGKIGRALDAANERIRGLSARTSCPRDPDGARDAR